MVKIPKKYRGIPIKVVENLPYNLPVSSSKWWVGIWSINRFRQITIFLQRAYVDLLVNNRNSRLANRSLLETLEHEYIESHVALDMAKKYTSNLHELGHFAGSQADEAHELTIEMMHPGLTPREYDACTRQELSALMKSIS